MDNIDQNLEAKLRKRLAQHHSELKKYGFFNRATTYRDYQNQLGFDDDAFAKLLGVFDVPESDMDKSHSNSAESNISHALDLLVKTKEYQKENLSSVAIDHSLLCDDTLSTWQYHYNHRSVEDDDSGAYTRILTQLARISNGVFEPTDIKESWSNDFVDVQISFRTNDETLLVNINNSGEGYRQARDITTIVSSANQSLAGQDLQFYMVKTFNDVLCVTAISPHNKALLENERNWVFTEHH